MRFEVPQFIEIEDKIFGPFTWKQFIYLMGGGMTTVALYFMLPLFLFAIIGIPIAALAGFLAFHQINNRPFADMLEAGINYFTGTKLYLWRRGVPQTITTAPIDAPTEHAPSDLPTPSSNNITSLSRKLELEAMQMKTESQKREDAKYTDRGTLFTEQTGRQVGE